MYAVEARGLRKVYPAGTAVDGVDLCVRRGECFGLLGPNGAGKTTTLRMLLGHTRPSAGDIRVLGHPVPREARAMRRRVGVVPQQDNLDPDFTVRENLEVYAAYFGLPRARVAARIDALLAFAALEGRADARVPSLSGGMQRRLVLARALVNEPELVVLDEPTTGLDPQARHLLWQRLRALVAEGRTLLLTTHYMEEAQRLCQRLAIMDRGRILDQGTPEALIARHIEPQVVELYGGEAEAWARRHAGSLVRRLEVFGETVFLYCEDAAPVLAALARGRPTRFLHRPANLEDVFLKLTGRELRD